MRKSAHSSLFIVLVAMLLASLAVGSRGFAAPSTARAYPLSLTRGSRLMIDARINGRPVHALLDSAAETTFLDRTLADALNLRDGRPVQGQGSGQSTFQATLVHGVTLEAVGLTLRNQTVAIADLSDVGRRLLGRKIDVILGREIFDAARLYIDIEGRTITIVARDHEPAGVRLELVPEHGVETIPLCVESATPVRATFDLGNGSHVLIGTAMANRMGWLSDGRTVSQERGGGLGGETTRSLFTLRWLEIAGKRFVNVPAAIDPQPSASDANVGISLLRHFRITTDFARHAVWLQPRD